MSQVKPIPEGYHTITPYLVVPDAPGQIEFLKRAFGGIETVRHMLPDGSIGHVEMRIGDSTVMLGQAGGEWKPTACALYMYVTDVDAVYQRAVQAGGKSQNEPKNQIYGDRTCGVVDPAGNSWWIATHVEEVSAEEMTRRLAAM